MCRAPVLLSLTLLAAGALRAGGQPLPPVAAAAVDVDGDGRAEQVQVSGSGQVTVARPGAGGPVGVALGGAVQRARIEVQEAGGQRYLVVRAEGAGQRLLVAALQVGGALQVVYNGPVGPLGRDGERALQVVLGPGGVMRYQTAPGVVRCDGEQRLFPERYDGGEGGSWRPVAVPPDLAGAERLRATVKQPAGARPWPVYRLVAASDQAGSERRADRLAPPLELVDGKAQTVWRVPAAQGGWLTARAGAGHEVRGLFVGPAPDGPPPPAAVALLFGPAGVARRPYVVELVPGSRAPQWVSLPQAVPAGCVSLVVLESPGAEVALAEVGFLSEPNAGPPPTAPAEQPAPALDPSKCPEGPALQEKIAALQEAVGRPDDARSAALLQALSEAGGRCPDDLRAQIADALVKTWGSARGEAFVPRYRILQGLAQLAGATPAVTGLLREVLATQEDPVLRAAAAQAAAGLRGARDQVDLVLRALSDRDPGVRQAALTDVALEAQHDQRLLMEVERILGRDPWPMVRQAAAQARAAMCTPPVAQTRPPVQVLRQALRDADLGVRRQGLAGVARCEGAGAAQVLAEVARDGRGPLSLRTQVCALLARVPGGSAMAEPVLRKVLSGVLEDPAADERSAGLAQAALRGLGLVGGAASVPVLLDVLNEPQSPLLRWEALQALGEVCSRTHDQRIPAALTRQSTDPDPRVRGAIQRARSRCGSR